MSKRNLVIRGALWLVIASITMEVCARIDDWISYRAPFFEAYNSIRMYGIDNYGVTGKPRGEYLKWKLNAAGFRGPEIDYRRLRIACMGASETFGLHEMENGEYPRRLEEELNKRHGPNTVQVVNVAYPGMSVSSMVRRLPDMLQKVQPSIVTIYPSHAAYIDLRGLRPGLPRPPVFELRMQSRLENLAKAILPDSIETEMRRFEVRYKSASLKRVMDRLPEENVQRFEEDLRTLITGLEQHGVVPVLVTHATRFGKRVDDSEQPLLIAWRKFYPMLKEEGFLDMEQRMNAVMRRIASEEGLLLVDAAEAMPPGRAHFAEFVHFTDHGASEMARLIADGMADLVRHRAGRRYDSASTAAHHETVLLAR